MRFLVKCIAENIKRVEGGLCVSVILSQVPVVSIPFIYFVIANALMWMWGPTSSLAFIYISITFSLLQFVLVALHRVRINSSLKIL